MVLVLVWYNITINNNHHGHILDKWFLSMSTQSMWRGTTNQALCSNAEGHQNISIHYEFTVLYLRTMLIRQSIILLFILLSILFLIFHLSLFSQFSLSQHQPHLPLLLLSPPCATQYPLLLTHKLEHNHTNTTTSFLYIIYVSD